MYSRPVQVRVQLLLAWLLGGRNQPLLYGTVYQRFSLRMLDYVFYYTLVLCRMAVTRADHELVRSRLRTRTQAPANVLPRRAEVARVAATSVLLATSQKLLMVFIQGLDERHIWVVVVPLLVHCGQETGKDEYPFLTIIAGPRAARVHQRLKEDECRARWGDDIVDEGGVFKRSSDHGLAIDCAMDLVRACNYRCPAIFGAVQVSEVGQALHEVTMSETIRSVMNLRRKLPAVPAMEAEASLPGKALLCFFWAVA